MGTSGWCLPGRGSILSRTPGSGLYSPKIFSYNSPPSELVRPDEGWRSSNQPSRISSMLDEVFETVEHITQTSFREGRQLSNWPGRKGWIRSCRWNGMDMAGDKHAASEIQETHLASRWTGYKWKNHNESRREEENSKKTSSQEADSCFVSDCPSLNILLSSISVI